jgi:hypothetical protein
MDNDLRAVILKLETRLGYDDRVRLHFFVGNHVPRSIREDLSLAGTLRLMESGLRMGWDGTKKSSRGTSWFIPSHPMGSHKKKYHPIPSHGIDKSSHPIPWVPWDNSSKKDYFRGLN